MTNGVKMESFQRAVVVGGGGREHALVTALQRSSSQPRVEVIPGRAGMNAHCHQVSLDDQDAVARICKGADLVVIGPEKPLVAGLADRLRQEGLAVLGASASASRLEGSKAFAKELMDELQVPTARWKRFDEARAAKAFVRTMPNGVAVKADGLAAGKGVVVAETLEEADLAIDDLLGGRHGDAGRILVIEERLVGEELSVLALCDGRQLRLFPAAQDHKRLGDGDVGPNTGGMGAYVPAPRATPAVITQIRDQCMQPIIDRLADRGSPLVGVLYAGVMLTENGPKILEYNTRFGDPETQAILPLVKEDVFLMLCSAAQGHLAPGFVDVTEGAAVTVVLAAANYPGQPRLGDPITGLTDAAKMSNVHITHAGTQYLEERAQFVTDGGRILGVTGMGSDIMTATQAAYDGVRTLHFEGMQFRKDIAQRAIGPAGAETA